MEFPIHFRDRMKAMLQDDFEVFEQSFEAKAYHGIRRNTLKCEEARLMASLPFSIERAPFSPLSYYAPGDEKPGSLPAHHAGMFYAQEPSASSAVTVLAPEAGDKVLDLCAAPGGKSTQIAALLGNTGLLWSNEVVKARANILLSNMERMGVQNAVVSSCHPRVLCEKLRGYFDKVLVDAPCSGEGMFRKDETALQEWTPQAPEACAVRQRAILESAASAVCEGGVLVYSTCTFSLEENEETAAWFLENHPEFELVPIEAPFGRPAIRIPALRIYPMDGGEGHFVAKFIRTGQNRCRCGEYVEKKETDAIKQGYALFEEWFTGKCKNRLEQIGDRLIILPDILPDLSGLSVVRAGVGFGEIRGKRIEPSHALFMSRQTEECRNVLDFPPDDARLLSFLSGEEIDSECRGYTAVACNGVVTGFGKSSNGRLKNRYPKGLRLKRG